MFPFYTPWKHQNQRFADVFRVHENGTLTLNGLKIQVPVRKKNSVVVTTDNMKMSNVEKVTFKILFFSEMVWILRYLWGTCCVHKFTILNLLLIIYTLQKNNSSKCTLVGIGSNCFVLFFSRSSKSMTSLLL